MIKFLTIFFLAVFADQISKYFIDSYMSPGQSIAIREGILELTYLRNPGAVLGLFSESKYLLLVIQLAVVFLLLLIYYYYLPKNNYIGLFLVLLLSGATGNIIDRIRLGYVIDFIDLQIWPVFNLADVFITMGTLGLMIIFWKEL